MLETRRPELSDKESAKRMEGSGSEQLARVRMVPRQEVVTLDAGVKVLQRGGPRRAFREAVAEGNQLHELKGKVIVEHGVSACGMLAVVALAVGANEDIPALPPEPAHLVVQPLADGGEEEETSDKELWGVQMQDVEKPVGSTIEESIGKASAAREASSYAVGAQMTLQRGGPRRVFRVAEER